ncbi:MAG: DNA primase [Acidobacteria bacterium]|nr:DNA primase [Acidobacteriota bacterium]
MPFYSEAVLDEVRSSVNIVSLISEYVALKKRGRNWVARCPFHNEKTPSFNVSEEKQIFMCFGCQTGGDVFKFVMLAEHMAFPEAVRFVAERGGVVLPKPTAAEAVADGSDTEKLRQAMAAAAEFYHQTLTLSAEGQEALAYLKGRGVTEAAIEHFHLGFSPAGGEAAIRHLTGQGYPMKVLEECGLAKVSEDGTRRYDAFRGRIMFPITDVRGRAIAFGGRAMGERQPKYLNSPETRLYNKSRNLFGLSHSREGIKKRDHAILVEGYMDCVVPFQHGVDNVVASLGTSLTQEQVRLLGRYTREVVVCYDADSAGLQATLRSLELFLEEDFRVRVFRLPAGEDPDTYVRKVGRDEFLRLLRDAIPYLDFVLETAVQSQGSLESPRSKVEVLNTVLPYLAKLPNAVERSDYVFRFARRLHVEDQQLLAEVRRAAQQRKTRLPDSSMASLGEMKFAEKRLLQVLLNNPGIQANFLPQMSMQDFEGLVGARIFEAILEAHRRNEPATFDGLYRKFAGEVEQTLLARLQMEDVPEGLSLETAESFYSAVHAMRLSAYRERILEKIEEAARTRDEELLNRLIEQRVMVDRELISLSQR